MENLKLEWFSETGEFPFFVQFGSHERDMSVHTHEDFSELALITEGTAVHIVGGREYLLRRGDVYVVNTDMPHGFRSPKGFHLINIMFRRRTLFSSAADIRKTDGFRRMFESDFEGGAFTSRLHLSPEDALRFTRLAEKMAEECEKKPLGYQTALRAYFTELAVLLSRRRENARGESFTGDGGVSAALIHIEKHFTEEMSVAEMAEIARLSERQFSRAFVSLMGVSPMKYVTELRMERARRLISETEESVTDIAFSCGYLDSNYFSRVFRKKCEMTPEEFRKRYGAFGR
ncbi:MAG: AraC family transcriptional regulator [Eubacteriales bacterium]|nr:AraC family transcriptional regulator [Eubacteriales bacterium]MDD3882284.1 AraC family transcriptional regulator [Eubacteriales bacterium]MDD4512030.1 AraC family transcriptional regulator [Eubacteriales bacterium]